ncbi:hypothetical protein [Bacillus cereus]|uniref:hypothetical protein n=1 Tax=Bacillus cereus TaxID=1396 RepID=UPI0015D4B3E1|nr:hypothetical protein [Bacillus cereus]
MGYSFEGLKLSTLKISTAKDIKYRVYVNGNDIGVASPHKVYPDGSHEILFTPEYYNMDGWEISKYGNELKVQAEYIKNGKLHHHVVAEYVQK